jgi:hypothetical protein
LRLHIVLQGLRQRTLKSGGGFGGEIFTGALREWGYQV